MKRRLITVEDTFRISGRGLLVVPAPLMSELPVEGGVIPVELRKPDGSSAEAALLLTYIFQTPPPKELRWACVLKSLSKEDVPIGTEIWGDVPGEASSERSGSVE